MNRSAYWRLDKIVFSEQVQTEWSDLEMFEKLKQRINF